MVAGYDLSPLPATPTYFPAALFPTAIPSPTPTLAPPTSTVEAATARVQEQGGQLSESEMRHVLTEAGWPDSEIPNALAVSWCESRWSPYAINGGNFGLFQMNETEAATILGPWFRYWGLPEDQWSDPVTNALAARWTWEMLGWGPWSCKPPY